jgi:hypothetical protein
MHRHLSFASVVGYLDHEELNRQSEPRILLRVKPKLSADPVFAVVDTAAPWCVFNPSVVQPWDLDELPGPPVLLSTRFGTMKGSLYRGTLILPADEGDPLEVDATIFLSPDWTGPSFIGYQGLLQRIRFAVDPEANLFYFGRI